MSAWDYYLWTATLVSFVALLRVPSSMDGTDNAGGSFVAALALGWLLWPAFIFAAVKSKLSSSADVRARVERSENDRSSSENGKSVCNPK